VEAKKGTVPFSALEDGDRLLALNLDMLMQLST
jgi:hypothetical protein